MTCPSFDRCLIRSSHRAGAGDVCACQGPRTSSDGAGSRVPLSPTSSPRRDSTLCLQRGGINGYEVRSALVNPRVDVLRCCTAGAGHAHASSAAGRMMKCGRVAVRRCCERSMTLLGLAPRARPGPSAPATSRCSSPEQPADLSGRRRRERRSRLQRVIEVLPPS